MSKCSFRKWLIHSDAIQDEPLIGELYFPTLPSEIAAERTSEESHSNGESMTAMNERQKKSLNRLTAAEMKWSARAMASLQDSIRFRYSKAWLDNGFPIGADLPLQEGLMKPLNAARLFGFLADRALDGTSALWFEQASAMGSQGTAVPADASSIERQSILLPHCEAHAGGIRIRSTEGEAAGSTLPIPMESNAAAGIPLAIQNAERGRTDLRSLLAIAAATTLPGRHSPRVVVSGRDEEVMTLSRLDDLCSIPVWREIYMRLARESGIETAQTRLKDVRGSTALLTSRIDRAAGKPLFTLSARTLTAGRMGSYLGIADILNSDGASPAKDLPKVWRRMAFALLTGAADAPERWLFVREKFGWRLAPAHGWRPNTGAARPMTADGRRPIAAAEDLVRLAPYFAMKTTDAKKVLLAIRRATADWEDLAFSAGAGAQEVRELEPCFTTY